MPAAMAALPAVSRAFCPQPRLAARPAAGPSCRPRGLQAVASQQRDSSSSGSPAQPLQHSSAQQCLRRSAPRPAADPDLLEVLELATDDELEDIYRTLHGRSLFSPVLKSLTLMMEHEGAGADVSLAGRDTMISAIDRKLRFLAADSASTLRGCWPAYRQVLLMIRDKLGIACPPTLLTNELEAEVFLHLLQKHADAVGAAVGARSRAAAAAEYAGQGDGGTAGAPRHKPPTLVQRLLAPLRLGQEEMLPALTRLGSALAVSNLQQAVVQKLGLSVVRSHVRYEAVLHVALSTGRAGMQGSLQGKVAVQAAKEGITAAVGRYAAVRSLLSVLGPMVWASTALELLYVSIGTDWGRIVKAIFSISQIRLLRTYGFSSGGSISNSQLNG